MKRGFVINDVVWHRFPQGNRIESREMREGWLQAVLRGRKDFDPGNESFICSIHFVDGEPMDENPIPTLFMTLTEVQAATPKKNIKRAHPTERPLPEPSDDEISMEFKAPPKVSVHVAMQFHHFTIKREACAPRPV